MYGVHDPEEESTKDIVNRVFEEKTTSRSFLCFYFVLSVVYEWQTGQTRSVQ